MNLFPGGRSRLQDRGGACGTKVRLRDRCIVRMLVRGMKEAAVYVAIFRHFQSNETLNYGDGRRLRFTAGAQRPMEPTFYAFHRFAIKKKKELMVL